MPEGSEASFRERRRDESLTLAAAAGPRGVFELSQERRATRFTRFRGTSGWRGELSELEPEATTEVLPTGWQEALTSCERELARHEARAGIVVEWTTRLYENSEGTQWMWSRTWCDVLIELRSGADRSRVACSAADVAELPARVRNGLALLDRHASRLPREAWRLPARSRLLLRPRVAAIVLHELIGHGVEEGLRAPTAAVPIVAEVAHPRIGGWDDEGVRVRPVRVWDRPAGQVDLVAREDACANPTGLAQAAPHGRSPRVRCTHMTVLPIDGARPLVEEPDDVVCVSASSGGLRRGTAAVRVDIAHGGRRAVAPFDFSLSAAELATKLAAVGESPGEPQLGRCTKGDETLPTATSAPAILLDDVPIKVVLPV